MATPRNRGSSLRGKLLGLTLFSALVFLACGGIAYYAFFVTNDTLRNITESIVPRLALIDEVNTKVNAARRFEKEFFLFAGLDRKDGNPSERAVAGHELLRDTYQEIGRKLAELQALEGRVTQNTGSYGFVERSRDGRQFLKRIETAQLQALQRLTPLAEEVLGGRSFLEAAEAYGAYQEQAQDLEVGTLGFREKLLEALADEQARIDGFRATMNLALPGAAAAALLLTLGMALLVSRRLDAVLQRLTAGIEAVGKGEQEMVEVTDGGAFAPVAESFNDTMAQLKRYVQTDQERQLSEQNLIGFLEVVSEAADGDLTVKAPVTADAFGSIADAYNLMVESLGELMSETRRRAVEVGSETHNLLRIFRDMEAGAEAQTGKVQEATAAVNQTSDATQEIANKALLAQEASLRVDQATGQGNELVNRNIEGMQLIRVTVQAINKKMKSLSERLLEVGTISELISEIATRTTILAMNASIEASRAGEQGRGFLVISDEIKKLADKSSEATKQIGGIIKAIQTEAGEVTAALEEETRTVEEQTRLAKDTGESFARIEEAIGGSKAVVEEITHLSENQRSLTNEAVGFMDAVSNLSLTTGVMVKDSAHITEGLKALSENLLAALAQFRLPGEDDNLEAIMDDDAVVDLLESAEAEEMAEGEEGLIDFDAVPGESFDLTKSH